jgi:hypothetical protein
MRARLIPIFVAAAACGAPRAPAPPSNHDTRAATRTERATALLRELADDLAHDRPIGAIVDPVDGAWLWSQPGAGVAPMIHVKPGDPRPPSEILRAESHPGMGASWTDGAAKAIARGVELIDLDGDKNQPIYWVDCGSDDMKPPPRALLETRDIDISHASGVEGTPVEGATTPIGFHFVYDDTGVYLSERGDRLAIAHVLVWTPCEA